MESDPRWRGHGVAVPDTFPADGSTAYRPSDPSDLRPNAFESVRIRSRHVQRRTANAVWE